MIDLDPRMTFDTYVIGPANRLATAAARRAADSPGTSYNPLFLYSASGLGKSHILSAIAHHAARNHDDPKVVYQTLEGYLDELTRSLETGDHEGMRAKYRDLEILLLDDVQFLTGQTQAQELLLRTLDSLAAQGSQVVLASDRPPAEINGLDARLLSRFSGGLIVDIGPPDYETRVAIIRKKAEERGARLEAGVAEAMARHPFRNVRELQGALNRVLAVQDLEDRRVGAHEVLAILGLRAVDEEEAHEADSPDGGGAAGRERRPDDGSPPWKVLLERAALAGESEGFSAERLRRMLDGTEEPEDVEGVVRSYAAAVERLQRIAAEMTELGNPWPEAERTILKNPERLEEAEALLASARERGRPFPSLGEGDVLAQLRGRYPALAVRAAERFVLQDRPEYNPLFVVCPRGQGATELLRATGRTLRGIRPDARVAIVSVEAFAEDFIRAISEGVAGAWRERWWSVDLFLLHGAEKLSETERAQDEFFHLFEALTRRGARIMMAADRPPAEVENIDERLRSRFEGGLVVELGELGEAEAAAPGRGNQREPPAERPRVPPLEELDLEDTGRGGLFPGGSADAGSGGEERKRAAQPEPEPEPAPPEAEKQVPTAQAESPTEGAALADDLALIRELAGVGTRAGGEGEAEGVVVERHSDDEREGGARERWLPNPEKVVWRWLRLEDRIAEED